ncbi:hypothetical protein OROHE_014884 [Orobanche hederae]
MDSSPGAAPEFVYLLKLLMIGDSGVGKSSLLLSFTSDPFKDLSPTILHIISGEISCRSCPSVLFYFNTSRVSHDSSGSVNSKAACVKPKGAYCLDIRGCDIQKQEIREAVELPLTHHELYQQIGIDPPWVLFLMSLYLIEHLGAMGN